MELLGLMAMLVFGGFLAVWFGLVIIGKVLGVIVSTAVGEPQPILLIGATLSAVLLVGGIIIL